MATKIQKVGTVKVSAPKKVPPVQVFNDVCELKNTISPALQIIRILNQLPLVEQNSVIREVLEKMKSDHLAAIADSDNELIERRKLAEAFATITREVFA